MTYGRHPYGGVAYAGSDVAELPDQTEPILAVEVAFTTDALADEPAWVDIAGDVRAWDVLRGRNRELERFQPGRATVVLSNLERQYDSSYGDGPWFGNLRPMRRMRIRETFNGTTFPIFDGYVDKWQLDYPGHGHDATATIVATDAFKIFQRTQLPRSVYEHEVTQDAPDIWWRLDEDLARLVDGDVLNDGALGTTGDGFFVNGPGVQAQGLIVNHPGRAMTTASSDVVEGVPILGAGIDDTDFDLLAEAAWTVEAWVREDDNGAAVGDVWTVSDSGDSTTSAAVGRATSGSYVDQFIFLINNAAFTTLYGLQTATGSVVPGDVYHIVCALTAANQMLMWVNGVAQTTTAATAAGTVPPTNPTARPFNVGHTRNSGLTASNVNWTGTIDEVAVYTAVLDSARITAHYQAGSAPWQDDEPAERIDRILDVVGWPAGLRELDDETLTFQSATLDTTALEHLQAIGDTTLGLLFVNRTGSVRFVNFANQGVGAPYVPDVVGDDTGEIGYTTITFDDGDEVIRNRAVISRLNGSAKTAEDSASVDEFGRFDYVLEGLLHRTEAYSQDVADFIVAEYGSPRRRVSSITLETPPVGEEALAYPMILGRELGDHITIRNRPPGGGSTFEQTCVVEGIERAGTPEHTRVTFSLSPLIVGTL